MKKTVAFLLSLLMIAGTLSACKTSSGNKKPTSGSTSSDSVSDLSQENGSAADSTQVSNGEDESKNESVLNSQGGGNAAGSNTATTGNAGNAGSAGSSVNSKNPLSGVNLKGATITLATFSKGGIFNQAKGTTLYGDACANRLTELQKKLNCKVKIIVKSVDDMQTLAFNTIASGKSYAHIIEVPIYKSFAYISTELATDLKKVPTMDLSASYVNAAHTREAFTLGKGVWAVGCEDMYSTGSWGYFFNKRILKECGLENPYTLVKNNKWTISKLRSMAKAATKDKDGKPGMSSADQYGILQTSYSADATEALLSAVGAQMLTANGKGGITYNMDSKSVINGITLANQIFVKDGTAYATTGNDEELHKLFMTGHGLFLGSAPNVAKRIMDMDDDYGFVPFPRGDNASSISTATSWNASSLIIPTGNSAAQLAQAGSFLQAFCYLGSGVAKVMYQEYSDRYFRDDESSQMLNKMTATQKLAPASIIGAANAWTIHLGTYKVLYACVPGEKSAEKMVQETKSATVTALKEQMAHIS